MLRFTFHLTALGLVLSSGVAGFCDDDRDAAQFLPDSTVAFIECRNPDQLLELVLSHPLREQIESLQGVREAYRRPDYLRFKAVVAAIEAEFGERWPILLSKITGNGVAMGYDSATNSAAVILKGRDGVTGPRVFETVIELARRDAVQEGKSNPIETADYRGIRYHKVGGAHVASSGEWLIVTSSPDLGKRVLDNLLEAPDACLANKHSFGTARGRSPDTARVWSYVDLAALRKAGVAKKLFGGTADNPAVELLIGGILSNLQQTPLATAAVMADDSAIAVELAVPHDQTWIPDSRHYYFGDQGEGRAPKLPGISTSVFEAGAYRDVSQMWLRAGDLFDDRMLDQLAQADSNLSTLFSGKDFGEDILGSLEPDVLLVVARQDFSAERQPAIKLPAFALQFHLKDALRVRAEFRRTFQSLIGFLNVVGAMNGQPQLDLESERNDAFQLFSASYVPDVEADSGRLKIQFNFSPTVAFVEDRFIVSSSKGLARELAQRDGPTGFSAANSTARLDFEQLRQILADNRGQLVAQNMLEEGHSKEEAGKQIDVLLDLIRLAREATMRVTTDSGELRVQLRLALSSLSAD